MSISVSMVSCGGHVWFVVRSMQTAGMQGPMYVMFDLLYGVHVCAVSPPGNTGQKDRATRWPGSDR